VPPGTNIATFAPPSTASQSSCSSTVRDSPRSARAMTSTNLWTGEVIAEVAEGRAEDIDLAVAAARRAGRPWASSRRGGGRTAFFDSLASGGGITHRAGLGELTQEPDLPPGVMNIVTACGQVAGRGRQHSVLANSCQVCVTGTWVFVERPIYEEFATRGVSLLSRWRSSAG
jgi:acyl-CoA reductase-like NAD-dependent aldehyde dehydrogenase